MSTPGKKKNASRKTAWLCPADLVIARFGGIRPLARKLNKLYAEKGEPLMHHSSVIYWRRRNGHLPTERQKDLQELAKRERVKLTSDEILNGGMA